jgi:hypothetical protein
MFPSGRAGVALLCLRLAVVATLFSSAQVTTLTPCGNNFLAAIVGLALLLGMVTPFCALICCLAAAHLLLNTTGTGMLCAIVSVLISVALALLGPGVWSVDAHVHGRRRVVFKRSEGQRDEPPND